MKTTIAALLSAAVIGGTGFVAYACGGGTSHSSTMGSDHEMQMMNHDSGMMHETATKVTETEAAKTAESFVNNNLHMAKIGKTELTEYGMMGMSAYTTQITLADGTKGTIYVDPETGNALGMAFGETQGMFHASMEHGAMMNQATSDQGSPSASAAAAEKKDSSAASQSQHNH